jgi:hypothetical protein
MNATEAGLLLSCHRAGREPEGRVQKALRVAESDTDLGRQLGAQAEFDAQIVEVIHCLAPPDNLRAKLGAHQAAAGAGAPRKLRSHLGTPAILAAVAGLLLFVGVIVFFVLESMADFRGREAVERMMDTTRRLGGGEFEPVKTTTAQLGDWLLLRGYEGYEAPPELAGVPVIGARVFTQDEKKIAQYMVDRHESVAWEFRASDFGVEVPAEGRIIEKKGWVAAVRPGVERCSVIAFRGSKSEMKDFLESLPKP